MLMSLSCLKVCIPFAANFTHFLPLSLSFSLSHARVLCLLTTLLVMLQKLLLHRSLTKQLSFLFYTKNENVQEILIFLQ